MSDSPIPILRLKKGREHVVAQGHPWIFSGAVEAVDGSLPVGAEVCVEAHDGHPLGRALLHPHASLCARVYAGPAVPLSDEFFCKRIDEALRFRDRLFGAGSASLSQSNAYRLLFSEADGLSGLIVDRYAEVLSVRVSAAVLLPRLDALLNHLRLRTGAERMIVRTDAGDAEREGIDAEDMARRSTTEDGITEIMEHGLRFQVDIGGGQKTGFYLDQRDNRKAVAEWCRDRRVLSAYCYTGAFETHAAVAGAASITGIDVSAPALDRARQHLRSHAPDVAAEYIQGDVPAVLRSFRDARKTFDLIILDPPRFVSHEKNKPKGMRAYKDINRLAMLSLAPGGLLATFSCSGLMTGPDFDTAIEWAARDSGRIVQQIGRYTQPPDHPVRIGFPESEYLKGVLCRIL